jgi:hypothetical protein
MLEGLAVGLAKPPFDIYALAGETAGSELSRAIRF